MKKTSISEIHNHIESLLKKGVKKGVFSGGVVGVYKNKGGVGLKCVICYGKTSKDTHTNPIKENTLFDLASLTKPLCSVLSLLHLVESKKITLDTSIDFFFGTKTAQKLKKIKIAHLMSHASGLKAYKPFYVNFKPEQNSTNKQKILESIFQEQPVTAPGEKCLYSDLGYIILGEIVERITESSLDTHFSTKIAKPLGLEKQLLFLPVKEYKNINAQNIAATQNCPWRKRILQGEVDDEHCWLMNGVAGHAGLFGTVRGVLEMCIHILNQWKGREISPFYSKVLLEQALSKQYADQTWCLGFDTPSSTGSSGGKYISPKSVGHLGFTGTSFWIDPEQDVVIVLLTNRVHPDRNNDKIKEFRPLLHDMVFQSLLHA